MSARGRATLAGLALIGLAACSDAGPTTPDAGSFTLSVVGGDGQQTLEGWELEELIIVQVSDESGAPAGSVRLRFEVTAGGGTVSRALATTSGAGLATVGWTLGSSAVRTQRLTVSTEDGAASVTVEATALRPDEADLVVVHGTLADLTGFVLYEVGNGASVVDLRSTSDTLIFVPPTGPSSRELAVFGRGNRPLRVAPSWTSGVDTIHVDMLPPVVVDLEFVVKSGDFEERRQEMLTQVQATEGVWRDEGMGIELGTATFIDDTDPVRDVDVPSSSACSVTPPEAVIRIDVVASINGGQWTGWGCWVGQIYLGYRTDRFPNLLAHELGHTFTLEHTPTGLMFANQPGTAVTEGEIYRAHFHAQSALNRQFESQPVSDRRQCHVSPSPCLPEGVDLDRGVVTLAADRGVQDLVVGPPVDENPPRGVGRHR